MLHAHWAFMGSMNKILILLQLLFHKLIVYQEVKL